MNGTDLLRLAEKARRLAESLNPNDAAVLHKLADEYEATARSETSGADMRPPPPMRRSHAAY